MTRDDLELVFVRQFQLRDEDGALIRLVDVSMNEKHERVRLSIWRQKLNDKPFFGEPFTYGDAFRMWSGKSVEARTKPRPSPVELLEIENDESI